MKWTTKFTNRFPCRVPILGAPMAGFSGAELSAETCRAGALGFIAAGHFQDASSLEEQIRQFRELAPPQAPLCIGFIGYSALGSTAGWERYEAVLKEHRPEVVQFFAPSIVKNQHQSNVDLAQQHGAKVVAQVGSVKEGLEALEAGVDCLVAQGSEAGGHGLRRELGSGTLPLAARLVKLAAAHDVPVLAAGGITDGRGLAAALALGCDGAVLGTRLWASQEAMGQEAFKQEMVKAASGDNVIRSVTHDWIQNTYLSTPWPEPYDSMGVLRNKISNEWDEKLDELTKEVATKGSKLVAAYRRAKEEVNVEIAAIHSGQGVGEIDAVEPAFDIMMRIEQEAKEAIARMSSVLSEE